MKVFISWSGDLSKKVAQLFGEWVEDVLQGTETWISTDDIDKGSLWFGGVSSNLAETSIGVLCLTRENVAAPWVLFEAGALSKGLSKNHVCPLLVNLTHSELKPPLSQFNGTLPNKDDMLKLIYTINAQNGEKMLSDERVQKSFTRWWEDFDSKFSELLRGYRPPNEAHSRSVGDMVEEILDVTRSIQKIVQLQQSRTSISSDEAAAAMKNTLTSMLIAQGQLKSTRSPWQDLATTAEGTTVKAQPAGELIGERLQTGKANKKHDKSDPDKPKASQLGH